MCGQCPVDDFIGQTFPTPKGGVLTVVGIAGKTKSYHKIYSVHCSICSEDKELFPDLFESPKGALVNGRDPCGCSKSPRWKPFQIEVIVRRLCKEIGYEYLGFPEGYKNALSKFEYICPTHGKQKASYNDFVNGGRRCPSCGIESMKDKRRNSEAETITKELCEEMGYEYVGFPEGYKNKNSKFEYICPIHGKQIASYNNFVNDGSRCPDCGIESIKDKLRNSEAETIVKELCEEIGYEYVGFLEGYKNRNSKFEYICPIHGKQTTSYDKFVHGGSRCPSCTNHGYGKSKHGYLYVTNWTNYDKDTNEFFKIGITNFLDQRIKQQARKTSYKPHQLIVFKFEDGSIPQELERLTKPYRQDMEHPIITPDEFADGATEILQNWIDIIKILPELIDTIREKGYTPEIEVGKRLYNKLVKLDKDQMAKVILDHLYK